MNIALLLAAGKSTRFGKDKLFVSLKGKPVIYWPFKMLEESPLVNDIFIAVSKNNEKKIKALVKKEKFAKARKIILGAKTRHETVKKLLATSGKRKATSYFIIHNAANPLATEKELRHCMQVLRKKPKISGVAVGRRAVSTLKKLGPQKLVNVTIPRTHVWETETPQIVRARDFLAAAKKSHTSHTDDLAVLEAAGFKTAIVPASYHNRKITTPEDLQAMKVWAGDIPDVYSVGIGEDSHRFRNPKSAYSAFAGKIQMSKYNLILGGVRVRNTPPLEAESDGDLVLHALCNAIASAIGEGSLGTYATKMCKDGIQDSSQYLKKILGKMQRKHQKIINCGITIEAARPKIDPLAPHMKKRLSALLQIPQENIGITATSGEALTPFGKGEAMKCHVAVLVRTSRILY